jgi:hypothetical protein
MHDNAQRAVVGVGLEGMDVRNLRDSQKREQNDTHQRRDADGAGASAADTAGLYPRLDPRSCQILGGTSLPLRIHRLDARK